MVHGVGVVLAFDRHAVVVVVTSAGLGFGASACEPVAGVDHYAGLRRKYLYAAPRAFFAQFADLAQDVGLPPVDDKRMVVPLEIADMVELRADAGAEGPELAEVLRSARCVEQFPGRNLLVVHFEHLRAVQAQFVVEDRTASVAREIEIDVVREVHDRRLVRLGEVGDLQGIVVVEIEYGFDVQLAGVILVAVLRQERHDDAVGLDTAFPKTVGEILRAAVQVVGAVVDLQRVFFAFDGHASRCDAVGAAADALARGGHVEEAFGVFVTEHHVGHAAFAVGHRHGDDRRPEIRDLHFGALVVAHRVEDDRLSFGRHAPYVLFDSYHIILRVLRLPGYGRCGAGSPPCR